VLILITPAAGSGISSS